MIVQGFADPLDDIVRNRRVDLTRELDKPSGKIVFLGFPGEIKRIDRNAVPAQAGAWVKGRVAEGFAAGSIDDFPEIDVHTIGKKLQLVHESNVDASIDIFEKFDQFCRPRGGNGDNPIDDLPVKRL